MAPRCLLDEMLVILVLNRQNFHGTYRCLSSPAIPKNKLHRKHTPTTPVPVATPEKESYRRRPTRAIGIVKVAAEETRTQVEQGEDSRPKHTDSIKERLVNNEENIIGRVSSSIEEQKEKAHTVLNRDVTTVRSCNASATALLCLS